MTGTRSPALGEDRRGFGVRGRCVKPALPWVRPRAPPQTPTLYAITLGRRPTGISRLPRALLAGVHAEKVPWGLAELEGGSDALPLWVSRLPRAGLPGHVSGKQGHSLSGY